MPLESTTLGADLTAFFQSPDGMVIQDFELSDGSVEIPNSDSSLSLSVGPMKYIKPARSELIEPFSECADYMIKSILSRYLRDERMKPIERTDSVESCVLWDVNVSRVNIPIHTYPIP